LSFSHWYYLLKLLQKHGTIEKFDLLLHRSGPLAGQPRGYAFCTYASKSDASIAKNSLDGSMVGTKRIVVNWAHTMTKVRKFISSSYLLYFASWKIVNCYALCCLG